jgi:hypothetical protein
VGNENGGDSLKTQAAKPKSRAPWQPHDHQASGLGRVLFPDFLYRAVLLGVAQPIF